MGAIKIKKTTIERKQYNPFFLLTVKFPSPFFISKFFSDY